VAKDYGNVFYNKDYFKMVLGREFDEIMDYADVAAEKCGDVVEMWLGMLDIANMTKEHITFMETRADPGELLAGLEASINIFHGTTRSSSTSNTKRNSRPKRATWWVRSCAHSPIWNKLNNMCMIEDKEIEVISQIYRRSKTWEEDDPIWAKVDKGPGQARQLLMDPKPRVQEPMPKG